MVFAEIERLTAALRAERDAWQEASGADSPGELTAAVNAHRARRAHEAAGPKCNNCDDTGTCGACNAEPVDPPCVLCSLGDCLCGERRGNCEPAVEAGGCKDPACEWCDNDAPAPRPAPDPRATLHDGAAAKSDVEEGDRLLAAHRRVNAIEDPRLRHAARVRLSVSYSDERTAIERGARIDGADMVWPDGSRYPRCLP